MEEEYSLRAIRPGRNIWLKRTQGAAGENLSSRKAVVLFIHGACAHSQQWREQESFLLSKGLDTVTFDLLGCGSSAKPQDFAAYNSEELYADVISVSRLVLKADEKVIVVGHSFGCALALRFASSQPDIVLGLILVGAYAPVAEKPSIFSLAAWLFYLPDWILAWMQPSLTEGFLRAAFHPSTWDTQPALVDQERQASNRNPPHMFKAFHRQMRKFGSKEDFASWAGMVTCDVLIICGKEDRITPLSRSEEALTSNFTCCNVSSIQDSSHQVMQEKPYEVNAAIMKYIDGLQ